MFIFFAMTFEIFIAKIKAIMLVKNIVIKIAIKSEKEIDFRISFIATAAPDLVLFMLYKATNPREATVIFMRPIKNRNDFLSCLKISDPNVAA